MYAVLLASALAVGCLLAVQTTANLQLNRAVGTPYGASTLQLSVAAGLLFALAAVAGSLGAVGGTSDVPLWMLLGGLASPLYITSGILLFPRLGALASVGLFVTGQMFASLGLDLFGLVGVPERALSVGITLGAVAVLIGITLIIRGQQTRSVPAPVGADPGRGRLAAAVTGREGAGVAVPGPTAAPPGGSADRPEAVGPGSVGGGTAPGGGSPAVPGAARVGRAAWIALGIVAGAVLPVQGAVNAQLREQLEAPLTVGLISFAVATVSIAVLLLVLLAVRATPRPRVRPLARMPWWGWLGGACAAAYVTATFLLIPVIGAATTVALTVTGQQLASAAIDNRGLMRMPRRALTRARLSGLVLLVAGSALVQFG